MKKRIFNIKGKRLVEGDVNLINQDEILVKELQDNKVALIENIDGKYVNIGGLEEKEEKRPEIVDTVVLARQYVIPTITPEFTEVTERINLFLDKRNILQYKISLGTFVDRYVINIIDKHGTTIKTLSGSGSYLENQDILQSSKVFRKCCILTPYISDNTNNTLSVAIEIAKDGYYELKNVLDSNRKRQLIQIRNGYCVTPFGGGVKPMRFKYPLSGGNPNMGALRILYLSGSRNTTPNPTINKCIKHLHVLFKKNPLFTFDDVKWLDNLSDMELMNHLISVKVSRRKV